jgi:membrane-associated phospholipid phosphatase
MLLLPEVPVPLSALLSAPASAAGPASSAVAAACKPVSTTQTTGTASRTFRLCVLRAFMQRAYISEKSVSSARLTLSSVALLLVLETEARAEPPQPLAYSLEIDGPIALAGVVGWTTAISLRETIGAATCRWCGTNSFDLAARRALLWGDTTTAETLVNVIGFVVGPAATLGADFLAASHEGAWREGLVDALLISEAATLASDVNLAVRFSVGRQRPWAWAAAQSPATAAQATSTRDANMSFYSGHATMMFAVATAAGTIATMRGYRWTPLVWLVGMPLAAATSYLRVASDDHWMTDVLVGVAAGSSMGFAIPYLAHKRVRIVPAGGTVSIVGSF